jgi:hypothetical protein
MRRVFATELESALPYFAFQQISEALGEGKLRQMFTGKR